MSEYSSLYPGELVLGKYRVERALGAGGMGQVYAASHLRLGTQVALKTLLPELAADPTLVERFAREAHTASAIRSEHVARVLDIETLDDGYPLIVMEYLEGQDLSAYIKDRGPLSVEAAADYLLQASEALAEAHKKGIVHRDLKPSNLFLTTRADGSELVKVMDFGIAKALADAESDSLTLTQDVVGSPLYMSPEQLRSSKDVDHRTDLWSLGVILFELVSGQMPFDGPSSSAVLAAVAADPPRPIEKCLENPPQQLAHILELCLQKNPDERFQNVAEFAAALAPLSENGRVSLDRVQRIIYGVTTMAPQESSVEIAATGVSSSPRHVPGSTDATVAATTDANLQMSVLDLAQPSGSPPSRRAYVLAGAALAGVGLLVLAARRAPSPEDNRAQQTGVEVPIVPHSSQAAEVQPPATIEPPTPSPSMPDTEKTKSPSGAPQGEKDEPGASAAIAQPAPTPSAQQALPSSPAASRIAPAPAGAVAAPAPAASAASKHTLIDLASETRK